MLRWIRGDRVKKARGGRLPNIVWSHSSATGELGGQTGDTTVATREELNKRPSLALVLFAALVLYVAGRNLWSQQHLSPYAALSEDVVVVDGQLNEPSSSGLFFGDRVVRVNGNEVATRADYFEAVWSTRRGFDRLDTRRGGSSDVPATVYWIETPTFPEFAVDDAMHLVSTAPYDWSDAEISGTPVVTHVNGVSVATPAQFEDAANYQSRTMRLTLSGVDGHAGPVDLSVGLTDWPRQWALWIVGAVFGGLGFGVHRLKPNTRSARGFYVFCIGVALFYLFRALPYYYRIDIEKWAYLLAVCFLPLPTAIFLLSFTQYRRLIRNTIGVLVAMVAVGAGLVLVNGIVYPWYGREGVLEVTLLLTWASVMFGLLLVSLPVDWFCRLRGLPLSTVDRQRGFVVRLATALAFAPPILHSLVSFQLEGALHNLFLRVDLWVTLSALIFPAVISYAIVRHNLLQLNELLREGLLYSGVVIGIVVAYAAGMAALVPLMAIVLPDTGAETVRTLVMAGAVLVIIPAHTRMRRYIDRRFNRIPPDFERFEADLESKLAGERDPQRFLEATADGLRGLLLGTRVSAYLYRPGAELWAEASGARSRGRLEEGHSFASLLRLLNGRREEVFRDDFVEDLGIRYRKHAGAEMEALRAFVVFPMMSRGRMLGFIALGERGGVRAYSAPELAALRAIVRRLSDILSDLVQLEAGGEGRRVVDIYPECPRTIGEYRIEKFLGKGGMALVYLGHANGTPAAVKVANQMVQSSVDLTARFARETRAIQKVDHPNIVRVVSVGWEGMEPYIALEYAERGTLDTYLQERGPLPEGEALSITVQAARGLNAALEEGIIHRDMKPGNLFVFDGDAVKVGDFGLARVSGEKTLTSKGDIFGTPHYMSPEVLSGDAADWTADQYALGVTLYELLAGQKPFDGEVVESVVYQAKNHHFEALDSLRRDLHPAVLEIVQRMMARNAADRFSSYAEILAALEAAGATPGIGPLAT